MEQGTVEGYRSLMPHELKEVIVSVAATVFPFLPRALASNPEGRCIRAVEVRWSQKADRSKAKVGWDTWSSG